MYQFRLRGTLEGCDKPREVLFKYGKLSGDKKLVQNVKKLTGDTVEALCVLKAMKVLCKDAVVWGNYPRVDYV